MQDRRRTVFHHSQPAGPALLARERRSPSSTGSQGSGGGSGTSGPSEDNPFAPPPEGAPDQPWQPRRHTGGGDDRDGSDQGQGEDRPVWGGQWSSRQPGRTPGGYGGRQGDRSPQGQGGGQGPGGPDGPRGMRWDPKDVYQRRARYALLAGMWGFFFVLFGLPEVALLLGSLALYWAVSALRAKDRDTTQDAERSPRPDPFAPLPHQQEPYASTSDRAYAASGHHAPPPQQQPQAQARPGTSAAVSGLVAAVLTLLFVAATYSVQFIYHDYFTCVHDSLTHQGQVACNTELPPSLRTLFGDGS